MVITMFEWNFQNTLLVTAVIIILKKYVSLYIIICTIQLMTFLYIMNIVI